MEHNKRQKQNATIQVLRKKLIHLNHVVQRNNYQDDGDDNDEDDGSPSASGPAASLDSPPSASGPSTSTNGPSSDDDNEDNNISCICGIRSALDSVGDSDGDSDKDSDIRFMPRKPLPLGIDYKNIPFKHRSNHIS